MATITVTGLASLDLSRLSLGALSNPSNYTITETSQTAIALNVGTEFSYRLTGTNLFAFGPTSTISSVRVTFGGTTFEVTDINLSFSQAISGGFSSYLAGDTNVVGGVAADDINDLVGNNNLFGGAGADTLTSGGGNDHLYGQSANGGSDGGDSISAGNGSDYVNGNAGNDTISGGDGSDRIQGGADNDSISGDAGNDTLNGNRGNDFIVGGDGNDSVRGGQDNDTINGSAGNDFLSGDLGVDQLSGGAGIDRFIFNAGTAAVGATVDTVTDFEQGTDLISIGFAPAAVLVGTSTAASIDAARTAAQSLFDGRVGNQEAAAINLQGGSTLIFWSSTGGGTIDSVASFLSQTASNFGTSDFI